MPALKLDLDDTTFGLLIKSAMRERRPTSWQAEVLLRRALGLPFPLPHDGASSTASEDVCKARPEGEPQCSACPAAPLEDVKA